MELIAHGCLAEYAANGRTPRQDCLRDVTGRSATYPNGASRAQLPRVERPHGAQPIDERTNAAVDVIAKLTKLVQRHARRIREIPVLVEASRQDRASIAASHGDDHVGGFDELSMERLWKGLGQVHIDLGHHFLHTGVQVANWSCSCAARPDRMLLGVVYQQRSSHLAPTSIVNADEQDLGTHLGYEAARTRERLQQV